MTKREFFENVLKMKPSDIGTAIPFNPNGETEVTEEWLISFIKNLLAERSNWHTGTPTEKGDYLCVFKRDGRDDDIVYGWCTWDGKAWDIYLNAVDYVIYSIVAWMPITPYEEN